MPNGTLLLSRADVAALLTLEDCIVAVEEVFREHGEGKTPAPKILGMPSADGAFHIKAALLGSSLPYFAVKGNGNFSQNPQRFGLPTVQGLILLHNAANGRPLAVMDSIEITILRTGAATAVAAKRLARPDSKTATICGCGVQGRVQLAALRTVLPLQQIYAFDLNEAQASRFEQECSKDAGIKVEAVRDLAVAVRRSDVCVTCTPARKFFLHKDYVAPGTFVAAVGTDDEDKQEVDPELMASSKVVADIIDQCAEIGDLHHAISAGLMQPNHVHAELGELVAGKKPGRTSAEEITIFDSTGTALQDVAAAAMVYERAAEAGRGIWFQF